MIYAIIRTIGPNTVLGSLRFDNWRDAMNYATISNLDAPDRDTASYGVVAFCDTDRMDRLEALEKACQHESDGLPLRVRTAYEALDD